MTLHTTAAPAARPPLLRRGPFRALLVLALAAVAALVVTFGGISVGVGMVRAARGEGPLPVDPFAREALLMWISVLVLPVHGIVLGLLGVLLARVTGEGRVMRGLGPLRIRRPLAVVALAGLAFAVAVMTEPVASGAFGLLGDFALGAALDGGWHWRGAELLLLLSLIVIVPLAEELFFRGWIWEELSRWWRPPAVMVATGLAALLAHGLGDPRGFLLVLPAVVALALARQIGGGIGASLLCHVVYNLGGCGLVLLQ
ncbi:CPBP family intramembrane glutamic endopeptidase [Azorhizobium caulinodans]|nr:CPBP family intramembrane glutamic endopeptidase [Azorhizobium caulinodans]